MTITPQNSQDLMNKDEALSLIHEIKNDVNSIRKLNGLAYPNQDIVNIQFLNALQSFKPENVFLIKKFQEKTCLLYTSPSPRDKRQSRMPSSA